VNVRYPDPTVVAWASRTVAGHARGVSLRPIDPQRGCSPMGMLAAVARALGPEREPRRLDERRRMLRAASLVGTGGAGRVFMLNASTGGLGIVVLGRCLRAGETLPVLLREGVRWARVAHVRRLAPGIARAGLAYLPEPVATDEARFYLAVRAPAPLTERDHHPRP